MHTSIIYLSKEDALDIFGSPYWDPVPVINYWKEQFTDDNHDALYQEIKFLLLIAKTYLNYSSPEVRYVILNLCSRYIEEVYSKGQLELPLASLMFLCVVIFRHRNITDYRKLKNPVYEEDYLDKIRQGLFQAGTTAAYQSRLIF